MKKQNPVVLFLAMLLGGLALHGLLVACSGTGAGSGSTGPTYGWVVRDPGSGYTS
jgi:hypothetical protein